MIELKSGRGNNVLESAVPLAKSIHRDIIRLGCQIESAVAPRYSNIAPNDEKSVEEILAHMKRLLSRIDGNIPLLQLVISASGENLSTTLPQTISPSRLLQASTLLTLGDAQFAANSTQSVSIGPEFLLSMYMLFIGHSSLAQDQHSTLKRPTWTEVIHKARVRLHRLPLLESNPSHSDQNRIADLPEYKYILQVNEDRNDGRVHEGTRSNNKVLNITETIPIREISKTFYANSGKILNLHDDVDGANNPVLLLKRDPCDMYSVSFKDGKTNNEPMPSELDEQDEQSHIDLQLIQEATVQFPRPESDSHTPPCHIKAFPHYIDPEWIAFEVFEEDSDRDETQSLSESDVEERQSHPPIDKSKTEQLDETLIGQMGSVSMSPQPQKQHQAPLQCLSHKTMPKINNTANTASAKSPFHAVTTSLSLLEMLIRLAGLQEFQQTSHLSIPDHILTFFLEESSTTGLSGDGKWKAASEAKSRVRFDPYSDTATMSH